MDDATKQALLSVVRSVLIALGGVLTTHGYMNDATLNELVGAVMVALPIVWGIANKYTLDRKSQARAVEAYNAGSTNMPMPVSKPTIGAKP